jgi:quercetin dioxygenase-like cupin family protein
MDEIRIGGLGIRFLQTKDETGGMLDVFECVAQPNARMPVPHFHESWDETVYGLEGTMSFVVDGKPVPLGPGEVLFIRRGVVHGFTNDTPTATKCLCVLTPGVLGPGYFQEIAAAMAAGPPDPAVMMGIMKKHGLVPVVG